MPVIVQLQGPPVLVQGVPQLSVPVVVLLQAGAAALQLPSDTQPQTAPVLEHMTPQLSVP